MRALAILLVALLWAAPAHAQTSEPYFGCPSGQTLETAPDPRFGAPLARGAAQRLVVRCVSTSLPLRPQCPAGMQVVPFGGADACGQGTGTVTGGTSNTVMVGEGPPPRPPPTGDGSVRTITDGSSSTIMVGESTSSGTGTAMGDGTVRSVNSSPPPASSPKGSGGTITVATALAPTAVVGGKGSGTVTTAPISGGAVAVPRCIAPAQLVIDALGTTDQCLTHTITRPAESVAVPIR